MVDSIEELFQIEINHPAEALGDKALSRHDRLMCQMPRSETPFLLCTPIQMPSRKKARGCFIIRRLTKTVFRKRLVPVTLENLQQRLLNEAIQNSRNAMLTHTAVEFRNLHSSLRLRLISAIQQLLADRRLTRLRHPALRLRLATSALRFGNA